MVSRWFSDPKIHPKKMVKSRQEREAGREVQMKSTGEQLQRLENACKEILGMKNMPWILESKIQWSYEYTIVYLLY